MTIRYKNNKDDVIHGVGRFNTSAVAEVLTGDDSAFLRDLDVFIEAKHEWVDMGEAFRNRDLITDNYNMEFFEPKTIEDRERGFTL